MNMNLFLFFINILFSSMYLSKVLILLIEFMCHSKMLYIMKLPTCSFIFQMSEHVLDEEQTDLFWKAIMKQNAIYYEITNMHALLSFRCLNMY
jgi:hypothetical protein